jgi:hypothetical protein
MLTHESSWIIDVGSDLSVDFDVSLHDNLLGLGVVQGVLQAVTQENDQWE